MNKPQSRFTDEGPTSLEELRAGLTRNIRIHGKVFTIRQLGSAITCELLSRQLKPGDQAGALAFNRDLARAGLVSDFIVFDDPGPKQMAWDELPLPLQKDLASEIILFATQGEEEVAQALEIFPGPAQGSGVQPAANGTGGPGSGEAGDALEEAAASVAWDASER